MFINRSISSEKNSPVQSHSFCPKSIHIKKVTHVPNPRRLLPHSQLRGFVTCFLPPEISSFFAIPLWNPPPLRAPATPIKPPLTPTASPDICSSEWQQSLQQIWWRHPMGMATWGAMLRKILRLRPHPESAGKSVTQNQSVSMKCKK